MVGHFKHSAEVEALRSVAIIEFTKGVLVLLAGVGALSLVHRDVWDVAESFLHFLRIDPHRHYAQVFLRLAEDATDKRLWLIAGAATVYSSLRFAEGYGLWHVRPWAEWVALISGDNLLAVRNSGTTSSSPAHPVRDFSNQRCGCTLHALSPHLGRLTRAHTNSVSCESR